MSIFNKVNDLDELNDTIIDQYYTLEWDYIEERRIKQKLRLKTETIPQNISPLYESVYYYPQWVFVSSLFDSIVTVRSRAKELNGKKKINIKLSRLEYSNMRCRFFDLIDECGRFKYKGDTFISQPNIPEIKQMMINYISKETGNRKYFKDEYKYINFK